MKIGSTIISNLKLGSTQINKVYIGTSEVWSNLDSDYQAVLNYATSLGYTLPSAAQQVKQNQLMLDLKSAGIWSKLDTFAVYATNGDSNFALIDWRRLVLQTAVNSPTFTLNAGFQGNGTSSYINTNFNPSTNGVNYTLNNACRFLWNKIVATSQMDGVSTSNTNNINAGNTAAHRINQGTSSLSSPSFSVNNIGLVVANRTSSTNVEFFTNNTQFSRTATATSINNSSQFVMRAGTSYSTQQTSIYGMGASLVSENTSLYNALNTYLTSL